jgi:hypothetical protein
MHQTLQNHLFVAKSSPGLSQNPDFAINSKPIMAAATEE